MDKKEFERIKAEEKAHLRKLRELKQQYRGVSRQKKVLDALNAMQRPDLDATYDETMRHLTEDAALTEARLEMAMEDAGVQPPETKPLTEADREKLRKAEAAALIRQMKAEMGTPSAEVEATLQPDDAPEQGARAEEAREPERTIGRSPAAPADLRRDDASDGDASDSASSGGGVSEAVAPAPEKTIGRPRSD